MSVLKNNTLILIEELRVQLQNAHSMFHYYQERDELEGMLDCENEIDDLEEQLKEAESYLKSL